MMAYLYVFLGGGLGSITRFLIAQWIPWKAGQIPWGTFWANLLSCIVIGALISLQSKNNLSNEARWLFTIGFCGGFSTFSTFTKEIYQLCQIGSWTTAITYIFISILLCILGIYLGIKLVSLLF